MRAVRLHGVGDLRLADEPPPDVPAGHSLVRVTAVGLCGSDLHWYGEAGIGDARLDRPLVLGHEFAGITEDGTTVAVDPAIPCETCPFCRGGDRNLCPYIRFAGHGDMDGGLRELIAWPTHLLRPLPPGLTAIDGAMLEPLGVALHSYDLGHVRARRSASSAAARSGSCSCSSPWPPGAPWSRPTPCRTGWPPRNGSAPAPPARGWTGTAWTSRSTCPAPSTR